ncbi:hypothetical protein TC41_1575 [Alicyclobacillus acidocaldarius subsp. acidocaldarius Tc-4-1]|uniref:Uncharacterized protein n=1 Tax=Alicyclobacillus acidocaldarius (strain Tc-4-1) TaxID=1048834 RepID=F8IJZ4_ALIAT|nr:hypothetical protein TC41_1575 [Alicyclobacillus acidocaldarius subsp. acidocaldarius Tc-4-1]
MTPFDGFEQQPGELLRVKRAEFHLYIVVRSKDLNDIIAPVSAGRRMPNRGFAANHSVGVRDVGHAESTSCSGERAHLCYGPFAYGANAA